MFRSMLAVGLATVFLGGVAAAQTCASYPYALANGQTADAAQVMANFNCAALKYNPNFSGPVVIGAPYHGDASLHITSSYGGFGRLTQISPSGANAAAFNLMGSNDASGNTLWWTWGVNSSNAWQITPGGSFGPNAVFSINGSGVGIGMGSPNAPLVVKGPSSYGMVRLLPSSANGEASISFFQDASGNSSTGLWNIGASSWGVTGSLVLSNAGVGPIMTMNPSGNVGIGTTTPGYTLTVNGTAYATGAAGSLSDLRHKDKIQTLKPGALGLVEKLRAVSFVWKEPKDDGMRGEQIGFIAQEVQKVLPSVVLTEKDKDQTLSIKYTELIPVMAAAIQEQQAEIVALKAEVAALKAAR